MTNHPITRPAAAMPAEPAAPDDGVCDGCGEPREECVCWEDEEVWDPRLVEAFAQHDPPLELAELNTLTEFGHTGCLIEVIDEHGMSWVRVYFDEISGDVYSVPLDVDDVDEMVNVLAADERSGELTRWPDQPIISTYSRCH